MRRYAPVRGFRYGSLWFGSPGSGVRRFASRAAGPPDQVGTHADRLPFDRARKVSSARSGASSSLFPVREGVLRVLRLATFDPLQIPVHIEPCLPNRGRFVSSVTPLRVLRVLIVSHDLVRDVPSHA